MIASRSRAAGAPPPPSPSPRSELRRPRSARGLLRAGALLLLAGALFVGLAPAAAQAQTTILVSNLGQPTVNNVSVTNNFQQAQPFTTGNNTNGYALSEVEASVNSRNAGTSPLVELCNSSSGNVGTTCTTLTNPASFDTGLQTWTAPTGTTLDPNTNYFIVFRAPSSGGFSIHQANSNNEDSGGATGWSIGDDRRWAFSGGDFSRTDGTEVKIAIKGRAVTTGTDTTAPALSTTTPPTANGATLTLTYDEALNTTAPAASAFSVSVDGAAGAPPNAVSISDSTVTLTLASAVTGGQTVTVTYTKPTNNPIQDTAGNEAAALTNQAVTNATPGVKLSVASLTVAEGGTGTYTVVLTAKPSANVTVTVTSNNTDVTVDTDSNTDNDQNTLTFTAMNWSTAQTVTVTAEEDTDADNDSATLAHAVASTDSGYSGLAAPSLRVTVDDDETADTTAPALSATTPPTVNGATLTLTYDETLDTGSVPAVGDYAVTVEDEDDPTVSGVSVSGSTVTLTLSPATAGGQTVTVSYTAGSNPVRDAAGNDAANLSGQSVTNALTPVVTISASATTIEEGAAVTVTFAAAPAPADELEVFYSITGGSAFGLPTTEQVVTFAAGESSKAVVLQTTPDTVGNTDAEFTVALATDVTEGDDGYVTGTTTSVDVGVSQSDAPEVSIAAAPSTIVEGGTVTVTFTADETLGADLDVIYVIIGGARFGVPSGFDKPRTATIASGQTAKTVEIATQPDDDATNPDATVSFRIEPSVSPTGAAYLLGATTQAQVTVTQDTTAPTLSTATVSGTALTLTYSEALDTGSVPATGDFAVSVDSGTGAAPSGVSIAGSAVTLTLSAAVTAGQTVTLDYTVPDTNPIQDRAGNDAAALGGQAVANADDAGPYVPRNFRAQALGGRIRFNWEAPAAGGQTEYEIRYSTDASFPAGDTTVTLRPGAGDTTHREDNLEIGTKYHSQIRAKDADGTFGPWSYTLETTPNNAANRKPAAPAAPTVTDGDASLTVTWTEPDGRGNTLTDYQVRHIRTDAADKSDGEWTSPGGAEWQIGRDTTLTYTISGLENGVSYDVQVLATASNNHSDWSAATAGTPMAADTPMDTTAPALAAVNPATVNEATLTLTYNEALDTTSVPAADAFEVTVAGSTRDLADTRPVAVDGMAVTLTLSSAVTGGETVTLDYRPPTTNPIQDAAGNDAAALDDRTVANVTPGVKLSPESLTVAEEGTGTYTVVLTARPTASVTVTIASDNDDVTVDTDAVATGDQDALTFTTTTWSTARTVTVAAADDPDATDDRAILTHAITGAGEYTSLAPTLEVAVDDDETPVAPAIAYAGSFTEAAANDGSVTGSVTATLTGDTFTNDVVSGNHVTASNVPAGLTASFARTSGTVVTLTLTGSAAAHASANDVDDLTIAFADGAFTNGAASTIGGSTKNDLAIGFTDASSIAYAGSFAEAAANDGSVTGSVTATLAGDTFASDAVDHVTASNVPSGLTASFARTSGTVVTLTLTGSATAHASANDVDDLTITFADGAFTNEAASTIGGSTKNDLAIGFTDASSIAYAGSFAEAAANDGSVTGSVTATLAGDTFASDVVDHVTASNVPAGLTASFARTSSTVVTLTLTGNATAHAGANDVDDLTITFADGAFTNEAASTIGGSTKNDLAIGFTDASSIAYAGSFAEAAANDGSVTGSVTATLAGDTFASDVVDHVTASNVPAGLTASFARTSSTVVTLTLTGNATAHAGANDVDDLTITFADGAFTNEAASTIGGSTKNDLAIGFTDASSIAYAGSFAEAAANDGSVTGSVTATLAGDTFASDVVDHVTASNVPAGLTASFARTSSTVVTLTLTGNATAHAGANDVDDLTITFADGAFTNEAASTIGGSTKNDLAIGFTDASSIAYAGSFAEAAANDGSVTGSVTATLAGDTFASDVVDHVTASNVPAGLTASFARTSSTVVTLTLTGNATAHAGANGVDDLTVTFADGAFTNEAASTVGGSTKNDLAIDFRDASSIAYAGSFTEAAANDGSVSGSVRATLTGDTFTSDVVDHVTASMVPSGLTASFARTSATVVTLTLTGNAAAHAHADDVSDLTVTFADGAFTNEAASTIGGTTKNDLAIDFTDASTLTYAGGFAEAAANDGSVTGSVTATLSGDTFTSDVVSGNHVTASNVPSGLTASFARTSATVVTLTLTGNATAHASANGVDDLTVTFADGAFTNEAAATVSGSAKNDVAVDFRDASGIAYAGGFAEAAANDGSVTGSVTATLTGDTFTSTVVSGNHVTAGNVPSGLTASFARTSATVVTLTLTGSAAAHAGANGVDDLTVTFADGAFTNEAASTVGGSTKNDLAIDFRDASTIAYAGGFTEAAANDGSVTGSVTATLTGDTFTTDVVSGNHVSASGVPAGLTASFARTSGTVVTLTLTGSANAHAHANDVDDLTVTFADGAFTNEAASRIGGSTRNDLVVDFTDASTLTWAGGFREAAANDGSVTGSVTATLTGDTFTSGVVSGNHVSASNVPAGLTASFARTSSTVVTLTLTGRATNHAHAHDVSDLTVAFADGAFTNESAATVGGSSRGGFAIDFADPDTPTVAGLIVQGGPDSGDTYGAGETIRVAVSLFPRVTVTGTPRLALTVGATRRFADLAGRSDIEFSTGTVSRLVFQYTVAAADRDLNGFSVPANTLELNGGAIAGRDGGAAADLSHVAYAAGSGHKVNGGSAPVDTTAPTLQRAEVDGATLTLTFDEALDPDWVPATGQFTVTVTTAEASEGAAGAASETRTVTGVAVDGDKVTLTLETAVQDGETVTVKYTPPETNPLGDGAGNGAKAFDGQEAVNNTPHENGPRIGSIAFGSSSVPADGVAFGIGERIGVVVRYDAQVAVTGTPRVPLDIGGVTRHAAFSRDDSTLTGVGSRSFVSFTYTVQAGDRDDDGISVAANSLELNGGTIKANTAAGENAWRDHVALAADATRKVDGRLDVPLAPDLSGVEVHVVGQTITFRWSPPAADASRAAVTGYRVERSADGNAPWTAITPNLAADANPVFSEQDVPRGTARHYRVFALSAAGDSPASATVSGTVPASDDDGEDGGGEPGTTPPSGGGSGTPPPSGGGSGGGGGGGSSATVRILHAEPVAEGSPARFRITLDAPARRRLDLLASTSPGTAAEGADYAGLRRHPVAVAPGESALWLEVATRRDAEAEDDETFTVTLSVAPGSAPARVVRPQARGTILDGPPPVPAGVPLLLSASDPGRQGFVRVINHSGAAGEVAVHARDDAGADYGPVTFRIAAGGALHFNSNDLEAGNPAKGLTGSTGPGTGGWRLELESGLDIEALAYVRHADGFLTSMHDAARGPSARLATFNPGSNWRQVSRLRLSHRGAGPLAVRVTGTDDAGDRPGGVVTVDLPSGAAASHAADALEAGTGVRTAGSLGDGTGKWRLRAEADALFTLMGLMESPSGHLTNLTSPPLEPVDGQIVVPLFLSAADPQGRQGFLRVVNRSDGAGTVRIQAHDDSGMAYEPLELALDAGAAVQFNADDLELGNEAKGLAGATGPAHTGHWWLELAGDLDYAVLAYARHSDGFLTSLHDAAPAWDGAHRVATFNPGSNWRQVSRLRLLNTGSEDLALRVRGIDDAGAPSAGTVSVTVPARRSVTLDAAALEAGGGGFEGSLGDGAGKWRLVVEADGGAGALRVMSLMASPSGHLTNLSTRTAVRE